MKEPTYTLPNARSAAGRIEKSSASTSSAKDAPVPRVTLLTATQVMEKLGVSRTSLWSLMRKRGLPYIKLGQGRRASVRFSAESLDAWLAQNEQRDGW